MACRLPRTELHRLEPWAACDLSDMLTMNLEGLEMIAVLVVVVVFVKVLEQFGLLEAGYDGKEKSDIHSRSERMLFILILVAINRWLPEWHLQ